MSNIPNIKTLPLLTVCTLKLACYRYGRAWRRLRSSPVRPRCSTRIKRVASARVLIVFVVASREQLNILPDTTSVVHDDRLLLSVIKLSYVPTKCHGAFNGVIVLDEIFPSPLVPLIVRYLLLALSLPRARIPGRLGRFASAALRRLANWRRTRR